MSAGAGAGASPGAGEGRGEEACGPRGAEPRTSARRRATPSPRLTISRPCSLAIASASSRGVPAIPEPSPISAASPLTAAAKSPIPCCCAEPAAATCSPSAASAPPCASRSRAAPAATSAAAAAACAALVRLRSSPSSNCTLRSSA